MQIHPIDIGIVVLYFVFVIAIGLRFSGKAGKSIEEYFISGRSLPWWLAGTSMVATTFAADTPLAVTGLVAEHGVAGNWLWWNLLFSGMMTVFLFSRLWRRAEVMTDVEFTEIRYSGRPAAVLRGFRAVYLAIPINGIVMGWVMLAMAKILSITLGVDRWVALAVCVSVPFLYSFLAGLWGVVVTDFFQFILAVAGTLSLAYYAVDAVGGISGLKEGLALHYGSAEEILAFVPKPGSPWMPVITFLVYIAVNWWASWYPGGEPGGGGYIAQRMYAAKDEKHALGATLWFNIAHYALRSWPWILVALASMVLYPNLEDPESGYVLTMVNVLPVGMRGILLATFAAAFMSTISTQLNLGSSYLVNDVYKRFIRKSASDREYVLAGRLATVVILLVGAVATWSMETVAGAWRFLLAIGAGTGSVYILRWYWWRINAWSEISAMATSFIGATFLQVVVGWDGGDPKQFAWLMLGTLAISTITWVMVTFLTKPENDETMDSFYRRVYPGGPGWKRVAERVGMDSTENTILPDLGAFLLGSLLVLGLMFGIGKLVLGFVLPGVLYLLLAGVSGWGIWRLLERSGWKSLRT